MCLRLLTTSFCSPCANLLREVKIALASPSHSSHMVWVCGVCVDYVLPCSSIAVPVEVV